MAMTAGRFLRSMWRMLVTAVVLGMSHAALAQVGTPVVGNEGCVDGKCGWLQRVWGAGGMLGLALLVGLIVLAGFAGSFMMRAFRKDDIDEHRYQS